MGASADTPGAILKHLRKRSLGILKAVKNRVRSEDGNRHGYRERNQDREPQLFRADEEIARAGPIEPPQSH